MSTATTMQSYVEQFVQERRRLGYGSRTMGYALRSFAGYVDDRGIEEPLTIGIMAAWARCPKTGANTPTTWARRLKVLRPFARWLQQFEPCTEVPNETVFGSIDQRLVPHIFTEQEIADLLVAARGLRPPLRGATYEALFGLLAATGLRVSEAVHLFDADVDLKLGLLTVRQTKFAKSRQVPVHPSTLEALRCYCALRNQQVTITGETPFFVGTRGRRHGCALSLRQVDRVFQRLRERCSPWRAKRRRVVPGSPSAGCVPGGRCASSGRREHRRHRERASSHCGTMSRPLVDDMDSSLFPSGAGCVKLGRFQTTK